MERKLNKLALIFIDLILINIAYLLAFYIKFEGVVDTELISYVPRYLSNAVYITIIKLGIFYYFNMHKTVWRYISMEEAYNIITAIILSNASVLSFLIIKQVDLPRTIYILTTLIDFSLIGGFRFILRNHHRNIGIDIKKKGKMKKVMIIGAGDIGIRIIREFKSNNHFGYEPFVIIDDNIKKWGEIIDEIPVVGGRQSILSAAENYHIDEIIIAIPSASKREIRDIIDICKESKCKLKILPTIYEPIDDYLSIENIREVEVHDLLGREEINIHEYGISSYITNKVVMITVGEDGVGLELCRQVGGFKPKKLIVLDISSDFPCGIKNGLKNIHPDLQMEILNSSIRDRSMIEDIFKFHKPEVIFHRCFHKEDFLMEASLKEVIKDNVFGTLNLVEVADLYNVNNFIMISTDKVVNPTNIIDASNRIPEMILQSMNRKSNTEYMVARPENVLNSSDDIISLPMEYRLLLKALDELSRLINEGNEEDIISYIKHIIPNYKEGNLIEKEAENKYA